MIFYVLGKKCLKAVKKAEEDGGFKPECDKNGKFQLTQCDGDRCWCVSKKKGKVQYTDDDGNKFFFPKGQKFDCSGKNCIGVCSS